MRGPLALNALMLVSSLAAQTVTSVQDGPWTSPTTWSCACVPGPDDPIVIAHDVSFSTDLNLDQPSVTVNLGAHLHSTSWVDLNTNTNLVIDGTFTLDGVITPWDTIIVSGSMLVSHRIDRAAALILPGGHVWVSGNGLHIFSNAVISGDGSICAAGGVLNSGHISEFVDICDLLQQQTSPPYICSNSGLVDATITWCTAGNCSVGISDPAGSGSTFVPRLINDHLIIEQTTTPFTDWMILDASGRTVLRGGFRGTAAGSNLSIDISALLPSAYVVLLSGPSATQAGRFVKA